MAGCRVSGDHPGCIFTYTSRRILVFVAVAGKRERERQETGGETMPCFLSSCDITMFVVLWLCHNKPCRFLYIAFPKYKVTDFKMWMVLPGWQIKNLLETNNICGSWYTCTTQLSSHRRAGVESFFSPQYWFLIFYSIILIFNFLKIFPAELKANVDVRAHQGAEVETCGVLIAKLLHAPNPLYLFRQS